MPAQLTAAHLGGGDLVKETMRTALAIILGIILATVHVALAGISAIQAAARAAGAVVSLSNEVVAITEPGGPAVPVLALAAVSAAVAGALTVLVRGAGAEVRRGLRLGYVLGAAAALIVALTQAAYPPDGFVVGPLGWIIEGGVNSAVHLCALIALFLLLPWRWRLSRGEQEDAGATS